MSRRRKVRVIQAPMAVTSGGDVLVNAFLLSVKNDLDAAVRVARESGLPVFIGVATPSRLRARFAAELDAATANVVGRLGPKLTSGARGSASSRSSGAQASTRRGRVAGLAPRRQGR